MREKEQAKAEQALAKKAQAKMPKWKQQSLQLR